VSTTGARVDPVLAAVIAGGLDAIATEMGHKLARMSYSPIIRESEDFGCVICDAEANQLCESLQSTPLQSGPIPGYIRGILLIDEIEQHLHPSMQAEILPRLSDLFPQMQIFATTHSPLVALDATPEELIVLRWEGDQVVVAPEVPDYLGYSVEDMLSDPRLFDSEIYGTETREKLSRYRELAAIPKDERDADQRREIRSLAQEMRAFESLPEQENETSRVLKELMAKYDL